MDFKGDKMKVIFLIMFNANYWLIARGLFVWYCKENDAKVNIQANKYWDHSSDDYFRIYRIYTFKKIGLIGLIFLFAYLGNSYIINALS